jgi:putative ABC transport system permease protein
MLGAEAIFLGLAAGLIGWGGATALLAWAAPFIQLPVAVDSHSLVFVLCLVAAVIGLTAFAPAWLATRQTVAAGLKDVQDSRAGHKRLRAMLVIVQVAVSLALLSISARGVRTLQVWLPSLPSNPDKAMVAEFNVSLAHPGQEDATPFIDVMLDRLSGASSVAAAGFADFVRPTAAVRHWRASDSDEVRRSTAGGAVTPGWFEAFGAPFVAGRPFTQAAQSGIVVNEAFASTLAAGSASALGLRLRVAYPPGAPSRSVDIVGVVADRLTGIDGRPQPAAYLPMPRVAPGVVVLVVRARDLPAATTAIKAAMVEADPALPWVSLDTLEARANEPVESWRATAWFGAGLGTVALLLAATGLHAVLTYTVRRRLHEIGIRMALGADRTQIVSLVLRQALALVCIGALAGLAITVPIVFAMRMFPNLSPFDPLAVLVPLAMLLGLALLAAALPAYRAGSADPMIVLRER